MLPGEDGISICRRLRASGGIPIIIISAKTEDIDRVIGLEIGADDYIPKPFNPRELIARVRALFRRVDLGGVGTPFAGKRLCFEGRVMDSKIRSRLSTEDAIVSLTPVYLLFGFLILVYFGFLIWSARALIRPLSEMAASVKAFGESSTNPLPISEHGPREVRVAA